MKTKLPNKLKIGAHTYKLILNQVNDVNAGETNLQAHTIFIDKRLPETAKWATLIHEVLHCMNSTMTTSQDGHNFIGSLAEQFAQVMLDNKLIK